MAHSTNYCSFSAKAVLVKVGKPATLFRVNEVLLRENSGFFAAALKQDWRESQKRVVELPEEAPHPFNTWLNWLYRRRVCIAPDRHDGREDGQPISDGVKAYLCGSVLLDSDFMDAVLDALTVDLCTFEDGTNFLPHEDLIALAYDKTPQDSILRKLLVYRHANAKNISELITENHDPRFVLELAKLTAGSTRPPPCSGNVISAAARCDFHEHKPGVEDCYRTKYNAPFSFNA